MRCAQACGGGRGSARTAATAALAAALLLPATGCGSGPSRPTPAEPWSRQSAVTVLTTAADPMRLRIPAIGVDAPVQALEVGNGVLAAPNGDGFAGWWRDGPEPGEPGPAVIAGHVDSHRGPAVFFRLREIVTGQQILVDRADGSTARFVAVRVERHAKNAFPTTAVYGPTPTAALRLVTCGGEFDRRERRYLDNVIVFAEPG